jgi:hypothetical protein
VPPHILNLEPVSAPPPDDSVQRVLRRLEAVERRTDDVSIPAVVPLARRATVERGTRRMPPPAFDALLRHLNWQIDRDATAIRSRIESLVSRHIIDQKSAAELDVDLWTWVVDGDVGETARSASAIHRAVELLVPSTPVEGRPSAGSPRSISRAMLPLVLEGVEKVSLVLLEGDRAAEEKVASLGRIVGRDVEGLVLDLEARSLRRIDLAT